MWGGEGVQASEQAILQFALVTGFKDALIILLSFGFFWL